MFKVKSLVAGALLMFSASGIMASAFRAADQIYLPVAGKLAGGAGSFFRTDVFLTDVSSVPVVVDVAFARTETDNSAAPEAARTLPVLQPGERREINDIFTQVFQTPDTETAFGHLIFFACRQG